MQTRKPYFNSKATPEGCTEVILSVKQTEVYNLLKQGYSPNDIAELLVVSKHTIRNHVAAIHTKLGTTHMNQLLTIDCQIKTVAKGKNESSSIKKMLSEGATVRQVSKALQVGLNNIYVYK